MIESDKGYLYFIKDEDQFESELPLQGIIGKVKYNRQAIENDSDWTAGKKHGDKSAADRFYQKAWDITKTEALGAVVDNLKNTLFISIPSSSGDNVHPITLGENLAKEFGGKFVAGETCFDALHERQSKYIPSLERVFYPREYKAIDIDHLRKLTEGKEIIIVDDIYTTGGSAGAFIRELARNGMPIKTHTGYFGDGRLRVDNRTLGKLQKTLKNAGIKIRGRELAKYLTRKEAENIISFINIARSEGHDIIGELTEKLQRISGNRAV